MTVSIQTMLQTYYQIFHAVLIQRCSLLKIIWIHFAKETSISHP
ncbi:unnamed protein product [Paramecium primaurelia]|uniref:Uncharacterized protein n=1 Tax=Paramecium primaurelia TaxID=5886 RepID=A0A8S1QDR0_PARPR|nr:unnamed protein product [Paramecium primaurelia]